MSEPEMPDGLDPVLRAALLADELMPGPSIGQRDRMAARMATAIGVPAAALLVGPAATTAASATASTASAAVATKTATGLGLKAGLAIGLVLGGAAGVLIGRTVLAPRPPAPMSAPSDAPMSAPSDASVSAPSDAPMSAPSDAPMSAPSDAAPIDARPIDGTRVTAPPIDAAPALDADQVARERALLDAARAALRAGDLVLARRQLAEHQLRYPSGALREEHDVLTIEELVLRGDLTAARARADQFAIDHPDSIFAARVAQLVGPR